MFFNKEKEFEAAKVFADKGDIEMQYKIGMMYKKGEGTNVDLDKAIFYLEKSSKGGYWKAQQAIDLIKREKLDAIKNS
jgi:TPR repeat protein